MDLAVILQQVGLGALAAAACFAAGVLWRTLTTERAARVEDLRAILPALKALQDHTAAIERLANGRRP